MILDVMKKATVEASKLQSRCLLENDKEGISCMFERLQQHGTHAKESQSHHQRLKRASVMVLISKDFKILLTKRSPKLKSHPGEVCFPGGKQDPEDNQDDVATALRETKEEVGLDLLAKDVTLLCRLRTLESMNHLCVTPIVAYLGYTSDEITSCLVINKEEVEAAFWAPLEFFWKTTPEEEYDVEWSGETFVYRIFLYLYERDNRIFKITGLTAHISHEVASIAYKDDQEMLCTSHEHGTCNGYLWRWQEENTRKPYWSRRYFVLSGSILHEYDNAQHAERKSQTANKKNRLSVQDIQITDVESTGDDEKHVFRLSVLGGRVNWTLAAKSKKEKEGWRQKLLKCRACV